MELPAKVLGVPLYEAAAVLGLGIILLVAGILVGTTGNPSSFLVLPGLYCPGGCSAGRVALGREAREA